MSRALALLDVDGPLNPYAAKPTRRPEGYTTHRIRPTGWVERKDLRVWLAPEHGPMLLAWAAEFDVELAWATTWEHDANLFIGPAIGLPELPVVEWGFTAFHWKFDGVLKFADGRSVVWFDDDFDHFAEERAWFELQRRGVPTLLHHVDPRIGLTDLDLGVAGRWLRSNS